MEASKFGQMEIRFVRPHKFSVVSIQVWSDYVVFIHIYKFSSWKHASLTKLQISLSTYKSSAAKIIQFSIGILELSKIYSFLVGSNDL